ncbi:putative membrane protein, conserved [Thermococcus sp. 2319x1]|nr:putative membrane protein, conserved [Thermococcus sp. 2319x1]
MKIQHLVKWEASDPIRSLIFLVGFVLFLISFKSSTYNAPFGASTSMDYVSQNLWTIYFFMFSSDSYLILVSTSILISTIGVRYERDTKFALSVVTLPLKKWKILLVKFLMGVAFSYTALFGSYLLVLVYSFSDIPRLFKESLMMNHTLLYVAVFFLFVSLYVSSISYLVSIIAPNTFAAFLLGIVFLYLPQFMGLLSLPPICLYGHLFICKILLSDCKL